MRYLTAFLGFIMATMTMQAQTDKQQIEQLYQEMYQAMVEKDTVTLNRVHADDFVLIHMTGMRQSKQQYINAIADGTLNYFSAQHEQMDISVDGDTATLTGRSRVTAAVFGGGRGTWRLQLRFKIVKRDGQWLFTESRASTY
ncbi:MAG: nuclear transport factor 2 family protein [Bacteroidales bacterium]|nr:nuclear transport factor 2 family protein [Bacteroidales bacterium]